MADLPREGSAMSAEVELEPTRQDSWYIYTTLRDERGDLFAVVGFGGYEGFSPYRVLSFSVVAPAPKFAATRNLGGWTPDG